MKTVEITITSRALRTISEQMGYDVSLIKLESRFVADLGCDSLDVVEISMALEDEFGIEPPDEALEEIETVAQAIALVETYLKMQPPKQLKPLSVAAPAQLTPSASVPQAPPENAGSRWLPIGTAPKDSTPVDLWRSGIGARATDMQRVELSSDNVFYEPVASGPTCVRDASHWMPVPTGPAA